MRRVIGLSLSILVIAACAGEPPRPSGLPSDAEWAGGPDGGAWILCGQTTKEPYAAFDCTTFNEDGSVWARGHFIHARPAGGRYEAVGAPFPGLAFEGYDGVSIYLQNGTMLVPDGWIDYPLEGSHGKKQRFVLGSEASPEVSY